MAAIVMEPTIYELPNNDFLKKVRKVADSNDCLLIFDEVITGFRFDLQGGQKFFDVKADLACFGKGMGNGLPISAISGPSEFMKSFDELWVSSTNNSETLSLAGTKAVINEMTENNTISHCWNLGRKLFDGWNKIANSSGLNAKMVGHPVRMTLDCKDSKNSESPHLKALILQEMIKKHIFISPSVLFLCYSHTESEINQTLQIFESVCEMINKKTQNDNYSEFIEGKMPTTVWTMKIPPTKSSKLNPNS
jgi:glutamate-1-semialdehyde aminotransferase